MKSKTMNLCRVGALAGLTALLVACGDDVTNTDVTNITGAKTVADLAAAGTCDAAATGEIVLNSEDGALYVCNGKKWITMKGADGETGEPGAPGNPGAAGKSCEATSIAGVGIEVSCGGVVVDTLKNGATGDGCTSEALKDDQGVARAVVVTCGDQVDTLVSAGYTVGYCNGSMFNATNLFCDDRDGKLYKFVTIGEQTWMAENLNYEYKIGDALFGNLCYKDSAKYCAKYGRLYTWTAAMDTVNTGCGQGVACSPSVPVQGVCPNGWHLPDTAEWNDLYVAVGGKDSAGTALKEAREWNGKDLYGFAALPGGNGYGSNGNIYAFDGEKHQAYFWTITVNTADAYNQWAFFVDFNDYAGTHGMYNDKSGYAMSVRCVKD